MKSKDKVFLRETFYSQEREQIAPDVEGKESFKFYRLKKTGQLICEVNMKLGLNGKKIEVDQITDVHINYCLLEDFKDEELSETYNCRTWLANGESEKSIIKAMDVARYADQTVITGDILDYLSAGAIMLTKKHIFERDPEIICTIGGHDLTKEMETGKPNRLSSEKRHQMLEDFWCHDIYYHSKVLKDKIIVVGLNNGESHYYSHQIVALKYDIEKARRENKFILIFQHEPISTGNPKDTQVQTLFAGDSKGVRNIYDVAINGNNPKDECTKEMYHLITQNADVIKGIFCGHLHSTYYTKIKATYGNHETYIPQIVSTGNPYHGHVGIVTRIIIE